MYFIIGAVVAFVLGALLPAITGRVAAMLLVAALGGLGFCTYPPGLLGGPVLLAAALVVAGVGLGIGRVLHLERRLGPPAEEQPPVAIGRRSPAARSAAPQVGIDRVGFAGVALLAAAMLLPVLQHPRFGSACIGFISHGLGLNALLGAAAVLWAVSLRWYRPLVALGAGSALIVALGAGAVVRAQAQQMGAVDAGEVSLSVAPLAAALAAALLAWSAFAPSRVPAADGSAQDRRWPPLSRVVVALLLLALPAAGVMTFRKLAIYIDPALVARQSSDMHEVLAAALRLPVEDESRHEAGRRLGQAGQEAVAQRLRAGNSADRKACLQVIEWTRSEWGIAPLASALTDADPEVAGAAMQLIARGQDYRAMPFTAELLVQPLRSISNRGFACEVVRAQAWTNDMALLQACLADARIDERTRRDILSIIIQGAADHAELFAKAFSAMTVADQTTVLSGIHSRERLPSTLTGFVVGLYRAGQPPHYPAICANLLYDLPPAQRLDVLDLSLRRCRGAVALDESRVYIAQSRQSPADEVLARWNAAAEDPALRPACLALAFACRRAARDHALAQVPLARFAGDADLPIRRQALSALLILNENLQDTATTALPDDDPAAKVLRLAIARSRAHQWQRMEIDPFVLGRLAELCNSLEVGERGAGDEALCALRDPLQDRDLVAGVLSVYDRIKPRSRLDLLRALTTPTARAAPAAPLLLMKVLAEDDADLRREALGCTVGMTLTADQQAQLAEVRAKLPPK